MILELVDVEFDEPLLAGQRVRDAHVLPFMQIGIREVKCETIRTGCASG
jgi:hypothetical protein